MKGAKLVALTVVGLWLAGGLQISLAPHMAVAHVMPDLLLVFMGTLALLGTRRSGMVTGFFAGVLEGGLAGANMTQYVISRTVAGFLTGWLGAMELEKTLAVAFLAVAATTIEAQILLMFTAPPSRVVAFLLATIGSAIYNGVLAMPLFALLKRIVQ